MTQLYNELYRALFRARGSLALLTREDPLNEVQLLNARVYLSAAINCLEPLTDRPLVTDPNRTYN